MFTLILGDELLCKRIGKLLADTMGVAVAEVPGKADPPDEEAILVGIGITFGYAFSLGNTVKHVLILDAPGYTSSQIPLIRDIFWDRVSNIRACGETDVVILSLCMAELNIPTTA